MDEGPADPGVPEPAAAERRLLARLRRGEMGAFDALVHSYQDRVFNLCLRMLGSREESEDLTQEIFLAVHRNLPRFRGEARLSTWIYRIARNRCLNRLRRARRRRLDGRRPLEAVEEGRLAEASGRSPTRPDEHFDGQELEAVLRRGLLELPERQRLLVILRDVEGLSYEEIVEICGLPAGTVKSRLHRARAVLAERVQAWRDGGGIP